MKNNIVPSVAELLNITKFNNSNNPFNYNPDLIPIIIGIDTTFHDEPNFEDFINMAFKSVIPIYQKYKNVQILFMGISNLECSCLPLQVSQFESDFTALDWLSKIHYMQTELDPDDYNTSYSLVWFYANKYINIQKPGLIITIGDDDLNEELQVSPLNKLLNESFKYDINTEDIFNEIKKKYEIHHIYMQYFKEHRSASSFYDLLGRTNYHDMIPDWSFDTIIESFIKRYKFTNKIESKHDLIKW